LWLIWLAGNATAAESDRDQLARAGGWLVAPMAVVQVLLGTAVLAAQPSGIISTMDRNWMYPLAREVWLLAAVLSLAAGLFAILARRLPAAVTWGAALV